MPIPEDVRLEQAFKVLERAKRRHKGVRAARAEYEQALSEAVVVADRGFTSWYWMSGFLPPKSFAADHAITIMERLAKPHRPNAVDVVERVDNEPALVEHRRKTLGFAQAA